MGGSNSTEQTTYPENATNFVVDNLSFQNPVPPTYQAHPHSHTHPTYPVSAENNPVMNDPRNYDVQTGMSKVSEPPSSSRQHYQQPSSSHSSHGTRNRSVQQAFSPANKERATSFLSSQGTPPPSQMSNNIPSAHSVTADSFEKAPMIQLNYVVKSSDNQSINTYTPGNVTVMRRTTLQPVRNGNKWYDNDYNKNVQPVVVKYV